MPKRTPRRWFQFSLRTVMVVMLCIAICLGWYAFERNRVRDLTSRIETLVAAGVRAYDEEEWEQVNRPFNERRLNERRPIPERDATWSSWLFGDKFGYRVHAIECQQYFPQGKITLSEKELQAILACDRLSHLGLGNTNIGDQDVLRLKHLKQLESLDLTWTSVSDQCLETIGDMRTLKSLSMMLTQIDGTGLVALEGHRALEEVDLSDTTLKGGLRSLSTCRELDTLSLCGVTLYPGWLQDLSGAPIGRLLLEAAEFPNGSFTQSTELGHLRELHMPYSNVSDADLWGIPNKEGLRTLSLAGTAITSEGLQALVRIKSLRSLDIFEANVDDRAVPILAEMTWLEELDISATDISHDGVDRLKRLLPACNIKWSALQLAKGKPFRLNR